MNYRLVCYRIYGKLPVCMQNLAISLYGLILYLQRYGKYYRKFLKIYTNRDYSSANSARRLQDREFIRLLQYAVKYSPYYKKRYQDIDLSKIKSVQDIKLLPVLTKEELKANLHQIYTIPQNKGLKFYTGGTTGKPIMILKRSIDVQKRMAYLDAYRLEYGFIANKMRLARFIGKNIVPENSGKQVFWRDNRISKQRLYSSYHLKKENLPYIVKNLNQFQPEAIEGFVSSIYLIAKYMQENGLRLKKKPKAVFTTAETVLSVHRELIEKVFECPLSDQYASNEGAPFIRQCNYGSYHEALDTGVFEHILTPHGIKLIVTSFDSYGTPLIRYDIGDNILESDVIHCPCGSCHPVISGIDGRGTDYLITKSRGNITLASLSVLVSELSKEIENIQFIQENENEILIKIVAAADHFTDYKVKRFMEQVKAYIGEDMKYRMVFVNDIEREKSGKFRMIINHMQK